MRFAWTPDQLAFRDATREVLVKTCPPAFVQAAADATPGTVDRSVWDALAEMGVLSILKPVDAGGLGLDECYLTPVLEECGRVALPYPVVETAMVAAPFGIEGMVASDLGGPIVPFACDADVLLLRVGGELRTFDPDQVRLCPVPTVDGARRSARVTALGDGKLVSDDPAAATLAFDRGALGVATQLVGLSRAMIELTVAYVKERRQFGVPVGSFQAIKHHLANALLAVELAAPAVARAAHSLAVASPTMSRDVSMAKVLASDAADRTSRVALQCHGAIGYTVEYELHLFLKRAAALRRWWGDRAFHAESVLHSLEGS